MTKVESREADCRLVIQVTGTALYPTPENHTIPANTGNDSVPIQLAQCWFPGLAFSSAII